MRTFVQIGLLATLAAVAGCDRQPTLVQVGGLVTYDGKPAEGVRVYFWPQTPSAAKSYASRFAIGFSDKAGRYVLKCTNGEGIEAGDYKVTFARPVTRGGKPDTDMSRKPEETGAKESLSSEYTDINKTKFTATVSDASREFTFDLKSK